MKACGGVREADLSAYADGELAGSDRRRVDDHLARCPRCRDVLGGWEEDRRAIRRAFADAPGPVSLERRVVDALAPREEIALRPPRGRMAGLLAAGLLVAATVGMLALRAGPRHDERGGGAADRPPAVRETPGAHPAAASGTAGSVEPGTSAPPEPATPGTSAPPGTREAPEAPGTPEVPGTPEATGPPVAPEPPPPADGVETYAAGTSDDPGPCLERLWNREAPAGERRRAGEAILARVRSAPPAGEARRTLGQHLVALLHAEYDRPTREAAIAALEALHGTRRGYELDADPASQLEAIRAWYAALRK